MTSLSGASYVAAVERAATVVDATAVVRSSFTDTTVFFYGALLSAFQRYVAQQDAVAVPAETADTIDLLNLLAFKTVSDVDGTPDGVKALLVQHPGLTAKLQLLSFLTLCSQHTLTPDGLCLSYSDVELALGIHGAVPVQRVVLQAVQQRLCMARINEKERQVRVYSYESRNVTPDDLTNLKERLAQWVAYAEAHLRDIWPS
ncbi:hypothetical protein JKF63_04535 [Porcisia hertigi]|uniref:Uncharacterized protein n=1 Tax=Porcisia hertigi TaxID=2761500 RepID=A0A836ITI9_9TRYP|nr:hypothetical protein JKF63_04535 [Porcisia hertigi]